MSLVNIVSALGDNSSIYPLIVRDCGIENLAKCVMTYKQNAEESKFIARQATRERIIDEYGTSAVWLGGIPLMQFFVDKFIDYKGLCSKVDFRLFKESSCQGINVNIDRFKNLAKDAVFDLQKVKNNKKMFQNLQIAKFFATTAIPIAVIGFLLPKLNFLYTRKKMKKTNFKKSTMPNFKSNSMDKFILSAKKKQDNMSEINFCGMEKIANMSALNKMVILDSGLTVGRIKTARNKNEKAEMAFKMLGMCFLNYVAPKKIEKLLNKFTKFIFGINTSLDVKTLSDKNFLSEIKNNLLKLPEGIDEKTIIDFIDNNPSSVFVEQIKKLKLVTFLENNIRDPRKFVETDKVNSFKTAVNEFIKDASVFGSIEKYAKKALVAKSFNTIANVVISSFLLAIMLPKLQFLFRKFITGSNLDPGIVENKEK